MHARMKLVWNKEICTICQERTCWTEELKFAFGKQQSLFLYGKKRNYYCCRSLKPVACSRTNSVMRILLFICKELIDLLHHNLSSIYTLRFTHKFKIYHRIGSPDKNEKKRNRWWRIKWAHELQNSLTSHLAYHLQESH